MPSLDRSTLTEIVEELKPALAGAYLSEIYQPGRDKFYFSFWKKPQEYLVEVSLQPQDTRLHLAKKREANPIQPFAFQMFLRKHVKGLVAENILLHPEDRTVIIALADSKSGKKLILAFELLGTGARILVLDSSAKILSCYGLKILAGREAKNGALYEPLKEFLMKVASVGQNIAVSPSIDEMPVNKKLAEDFGKTGEAEGSAEEATLRRSLSARIKKIERTVQNVNADIVKAEEAVASAKDTEWLKPYIHTIKRGMSEISVTTPLGDILVVKLEPEFSPKENIEKIFSRARRLSRRLDEIRERLVQLEKARDELKKIILCEGEDFLTSAKIFLQSVSKQGGDKQPQAKETGRHLPYKEFMVRGVKVLVGKGGKDNHELTFHVASPHDYWLHVKGFAGSHVVIVSKKGTVPDEATIIEAAKLAAKYSKAPEGEPVEVAFVKRAFVKPVKGEQGKVTYINERTIMIKKESE